MRDLLIKEKWFTKLKNAPEEVLKEVCYRLVKYGCFEENIDESGDSYEISYPWDEIKGNIDRMWAAKEGNIENGRKNGKKMIADPQMIYDYCQANPKAKANDVGEALGLPKTPAAKSPYAYIYDNPGWKNRKVSNWKFSEENSEQNLNSEKNSDEQNSNSEKFSDIGKNSKWEF